MKIAIEGQRLFRAKKHGMDMVALELIKNLQQIDSSNQYVVFIKPDTDHSCLSDSDNVKLVELPGMTYPYWEQVALPRAAKEYGCDLLHCTSNTAPIFTRMPLVVTLHDIIYMESLSLFKKSMTSYQRFGNLYRRYIVPEVVRKSKRIITVSNFEKERIAKFFGMKDDPRLVAIHNGVGEHFKRISDSAVLERVKKQYNLPDKFFFHLGNTDPKKNTKGVLAAYSAFLKKSDQKISLVMLDFDLGELDRILTEIGDADLKQYIHLTGYVVNSDLPAIYSLTSIFLYPSLRESFGLPILEAMACGTPVITSTTSSMPEIAGDAAYLVDPFDTAQITNAIFKLLKSSSLCDELIKKGYAQAKLFSWRAMAEQVLNLYKEVV